MAVEHGHGEWPFGRLEEKTPAGWLGVERIWGAEPVDTHVVLSCPAQLVDHDAKPGLCEEHSTPMHDRSIVPLEPKVFAYRHAPTVARLVPQQSRRREVHAAEPALLHHLVAAIHGDSVVAGRAVEMVMHLLVSVAVTSSVDGDRVAVPVEIDVQHIELAETLAHGPAAECRKRVFILGPQQVIAALEGHRRARTSRPRSLQC